jgi:hypothetical protein
MADLKYHSVAFAGSGSVDSGTATELLNDWLPPNLGGVYRPARTPRKHATLNAVVNWLETEPDADNDTLGPGQILDSQDVVQSLVERKGAGDDVTLVYLLPDEPSKDDLALLRAAFDAGISVKNLAGSGALNDIDPDELFPPEPEPTSEEATAEIEADPQAMAAIAEDRLRQPPLVPGSPYSGEAFLGAFTGFVTGLVYNILRSEGLLTAGAPAADDVVAKVAAKLNGDVPFDTNGSVPASTVFKTAGTSSDADEDKIKYFHDTTTGMYRRARTRPRKTSDGALEKVAMLNLDEIDDLVRRGLIEDDKDEKTTRRMAGSTR